LSDKYSNHNTYTEWLRTRHGVQESTHGPLLCLVYVNESPKTENNTHKLVIFAGYTSIIITNPNTSAFTNKINKVFEGINDWFNANSLSLNTEKIYFTQFSNKNISLTNLNITHDNKAISNISNMKFLGIIRQAV
jgi:hypothetical protein